MQVILNGHFRFTEVADLSNSLPALLLPVSVIEYVNRIADSLACKLTLNDE